MKMHRMKSFVPINKIFHTHSTGNVPNSNEAQNSYIISKPYVTENGTIQPPLKPSTRLPYSPYSNNSNVSLTLGAICRSGLQYFSPNFLRLWYPGYVSLEETRKSRYQNECQQNLNFYTYSYYLSQIVIGKGKNLAELLKSQAVGGRGAMVWEQDETKKCFSFILACQRFDKRNVCLWNLINV